MRSASPSTCRTCGPASSRACPVGGRDHSGARSSCQNAVLGALTTLGLSWHATRQYLSEWLHDGADRAAPCRVQLDMDACFAPLLRWVLAWWQSTELTLAIDPTSKGTDRVALVISVVYRGLALPVAWRIKTGGQPSSWMPDLCDRGLQSPRLWQAIRRQGWHPYMRYDRHITFQAATGPRWSAWRFVAHEGQYTVTAGRAFRARKRRGTLIVLWVPNQETPWVLLTDKTPDDVDLGAYGMRVWIEQGFRTLKRMGWQWQCTRRTDPARVDRHWLALAVATLWVLAHSTRVEEAHLRGLAPGPILSSEPSTRAWSPGVNPRRSSWSPPYTSC